MLWCRFICLFFFKQKTAYEMRISDWSSDVCSSDLAAMKPALLALPLALLLLLLAPASRANDYPTETVSDYVLACMAANGNTAEALRQCSCSIDVLASLLRYEDYTAAETVLRLRPDRNSVG